MFFLFSPFFFFSPINFLPTFKGFRLFTTSIGLSSSFLIFILFGFFRTWIYVMLVWQLSISHCIRSTTFYSKGSSIGSYNCYWTVCKCLLLREHPHNSRSILLRLGVTTGSETSRWNSSDRIRGHRPIDCHRSRRTVIVGIRGHQSQGLCEPETGRVLG